MPRAPFRSTFFAAILFHSRYNPFSIAAVFGDESVSYVRFVRDIERVTRRLSAAGVGSCKRVVVGVSHPYMHWLLTIGLGRLGVTSVTAYGTDPEMFKFIGADAVVTSQDLVDTQRLVVRVTNEWSSGSPEDFPAFAEAECGQDHPLRLLLSSGTTGTPKKILVTHGQYQERMRSAGRGGVSATARVLTLFGFDTAGGFQVPMSTWTEGGRVVLLMPQEVPYIALRRHGVTSAFMAPTQLAAMLKSMPRNVWPVEGLAISVAGSALPRGLAQEARLRLTQSLAVVYGSTEASAVSRMHAGMENGVLGGYVVPEVEVQVVDGAGVPVAPGIVGEIRVRGAAMVNGYADETAQPPAPDEAFRGGWFHPGDAGALSPDGFLTIVGRTKELMNLGGVKISPNVIEEALRDCVGVEDIAAFSVDSPNSTDEPWLAVVRGSDYDPAVVPRSYKQRFPHLPGVRIAYVVAIPRNGMGKVLRLELRKMVKAQAAPAAPVQLH